MLFFRAKVTWHYILLGVLDMSSFQFKLLRKLSKLKAAGANTRNFKLQDCLM